MKARVFIVPTEAWLGTSSLLLQPYFLLAFMCVVGDTDLKKKFILTKISCQEAATFLVLAGPSVQITST